MKYLVIVMMLIFFYPTAVLAEERIIKIGENHIQVQTIYYRDPVGTEEVTYSVEDYGQDRVDNEREMKQQELVEWTKLRDVGIINFQKQNVADKIAEIKEHLAKLDKIEALLSEEVSQ